MALTKITKTGITDASVERAKVGADAIDATKIADDAISEEHLDITAITGHTELAETAADNDVLLIYDTTAGALKKIQRTNVLLQVPTVTAISPTTVQTGDGTGNHTFTITGTKFDSGATAKFLTAGGADVTIDTVTRNSATSITAVIAKSSLPDSGEPYDIRVTNSSGLASTLANQVNVNAQPIFTTAAGSLGSSRTSMSSASVNATDPESAGNVTFELQSGSLPAGISINNTAAEGGTALFSGTFSSLASSDTVHNFVLRAVDAASNTSSRAFSFTATGPVISSFTSSGTFAVPSGITQLTAVMVVAGGGGGGGDNGGGAGAGGLIFMPNYPVNPGGTLTVTVGSGGTGSSDLSPYCQAGQDGQNSVFGAPGDPGKHPSGDVLTAVGGGGGGGGNPSKNGASGGSGGGGGGHNCGAGASAQQPTQSGDSGAYGFGAPGGDGSNAPIRAGGGGGGAIGGGANSPGPAGGGAGGVGKAYTIADGTTSVFYAGGGGGGSAQAGQHGAGGQGGGGRGANTGEGAGATANRGGGGGGGSNNENSPDNRGGGQGGKGIVIVTF